MNLATKKRCKHDWYFDSFHMLGKACYVRGWRCLKCKKFKERKRTGGDK